MGLCIWLTAELTWTYYQLGLRIETPFPSPADGFWLAGYGFLIYHLYRIYNSIENKPLESKVVAIISIDVAASLAFILYLIYASSDVVPQSTLELLINMSYPVFDAVLLAPALVVLWTLRGDPAYTHWVMISLFIIFVTIADIGFDYALAVDKNSANKQEWIWDMFYNAGYLFIAGALFWYNRYIILTNLQVRSDENNS